jgi:hypothetical protein
MRAVIVIVLMKSIRYICTLRWGEIYEVQVPVFLCDRLWDEPVAGSKMSRLVSKKLLILSKIWWTLSVKFLILNYSDFDFHL